MPFGTLLIVEDIWCWHRQIAEIQRTLDYDNINGLPRFYRTALKKITGEQAGERARASDQHSSDRNSPQAEMPKT